MPLRGAFHRFALGFLVVASFSLMFLGKTETMFVERLRTSVTDVAAPILEVLAEPVAAVDRALDGIAELAYLHEENRRLRDEVARLRGWQAAALRLEAENRGLRDLVRYAGPDRHSFITARVVADGRGPFVKSVLVNVGTRDGIGKGQAATTPLGLVGRISEAGDRSARVLMLTDLNSRIPVLVHETRARAILAGDNSHQPQLVFLPESAGVKRGQRIVTSGHGGSLPAGLPVGIVSSVEGGVVRVRPYVDWERLEYVQIIEFADAEASRTAARTAAPVVEAPEPSP